MSAGVRLLQKMGWRQGRGIGTADASTTSSGAKGSRWGQVAGVGVENAPLYTLEPKQNLQGLGFDPFRVRHNIHLQLFLGHLSCSEAHASLM